MFFDLSVGELILADIVAWLVIHLAVAWLGTRLSSERFNPAGWLYRRRCCEQERAYERWLHIKAWKRWLPDGAALFAGGFRKRRLQRKSREYFGAFVRETCRGEAVHWVVFLCAALFFLWNPWPVGVLMVVYAGLANGPCIVVQRYNRLRLLRTLGAAGQRELQDRERSSSVDTPAEAARGAPEDSLPGSVILADGRRLAFAEWGSPDGVPVLFFHGMPGSRFFRHPDPALTRAAGVRLITVDRPGYGQSDNLSGRTLRNWPRDVAQLLDALALDACVVAGMSAGGPHALACAHELPERVRRLGLISSVGNLDTPEIRQLLVERLPTVLQIAGKHPFVLRFLIGGIARIVRRRPELVRKLTTKSLCPSDRDLTKKPDIAAMTEQDVRAAYRRGGGGQTGDMLALAGPWGFALESIHAPTLLWHGTDDTLVPCRVAQLTADALPDCRSEIFPGEGHFLVLHHWQKIFRQLAGTV